MPRILDNRNEETSENLASVLYLNSLSIQIHDTTVHMVYGWLGHFWSGFQSMACVQDWKVGLEQLCKVEMQWNRVIVFNVCSHMQDLDKSCIE